jgi:hypothetical protein
VSVAVVVTGVLILFEGLVEPTAVWVVIDVSRADG